jgi:hypothetical protein
MRFAKHVLAALLILGLFCPLGARAEEPWIMWVYYSDSRQSFWALMEPLPSYDACIAYKDRALEAYRVVGHRKVEGDTVEGITGSNSQGMFKCFPASVNPNTLLP